MTRESQRQEGLKFEQLEQRALLAIDSGLASNHFRPYDVNRDGIVSPIDALQVINQLNRYGVQSVATASSLRMAASAAVPGSNSATDMARFDVNGDGIISPLDALKVINQLNNPDTVRIRLEVTDTNGTPITQIAQNGDFQLRVYVQDLRGVEDGGVFSAYADVEFDSNLATTTGEINFVAPYTGAPTGDLNTPGLINDAGALDGTTPLGPSERLLFTVPMKAIGSGTLMFSSNPADALGLDVTVYGINEAISPEEIEFGSVALEILGVPTVAINNVTALEGNGGTTPFEFTVTLSAAATGTVTVQYATAPGTATADVDYQSGSGSVVFNVGETEKKITVLVSGDDVFEGNETFFVNLTGVTGPATIADGQGLGTIVDDDGAPQLTITDVSEAEGNAGTKKFVFTVSLSGATASPVTVDYATVAGTATANTDFVAASGSLSFGVGDTSKTIEVTINGDTIYEANETFQVVLSNAVGAEIGKGTGQGVIENDDDPPNVNIADAGTVTEPVSGTVDATFVVTLSQMAGVPVTVSYATLAGTATSGGDFEATSGQLTFAPGETEKSIVVKVKADDESEGDETFTVVLSSPTNAQIVDGVGLATIRDQVFDKLARIRLSFTDLNGDEITSIRGGDDFFLNVFVQDLRDVPSNQAGVFQAYLDVVYENNFLSVLPGTEEFSTHYPNQQEFEFSDALGLINDSGAFDGQSPLGLGELLLFRVKVRGIAGGTTTVQANSAETLDRDVLLFGMDRALAAGEVQFLADSITILPPSLITSVPVSITEGDSGSKQLTFTVNLERQDDRIVTVAYSTSPGTATAGVDYQSASGTLTFGAGVTSQTVNVTILGDTLNELDETFFLNLGSATNAVIAASSAQVTGTILNDDPAPSISFDDVNVVEGLGNAEIVLKLSAASGRAVTVNYATGGGTATSGVDYVAASGQVTFQPGETEKKITVTVVGDQVVEGDETFLVNFTGPQGATLSRTSATVTISDLKLGSIGGYVYGDINRNGVRDATDLGLAGVTVQLIGKNVFGETVQLTQKTGEGGRYSFGNLVPGTYRVIETQPSVLKDGDEQLGDAGGSITANDEFTLTLGAGINADGYNFGERGILSDFLNHNIFFASSLNN